MRGGGCPGDKLGTIKKQKKWPSTLTYHCSGWPGEQEFGSHARGRGGGFFRSCGIIPGHVLGWTPGLLSGGWGSWFMATFLAQRLRIAVMCVTDAIWDLWGH